MFVYKTFNQTFNQLPLPPSLLLRFFCTCPLLFTTIIYDSLERLVTLISIRMLYILIILSPERVSRTQCVFWGG